MAPYTRGDVSNFKLPPAALDAEPAVHECVQEAYLDTPICKVADANSFPQDEADETTRSVYSRWRIDNATGEYDFLVEASETPVSSGKGQLVTYRSADDSVFTVLNDVFSAESAEFRWDHSPARANTMCYVAGCEFRSYDLDTRTSSLVHDFQVEFPSCGHRLNNVEGDSSVDSRYWAFMIQGPYDGWMFPMQAIVTFDRKQDTILGTLDLAKFHAMGGSGDNLPRPNMVDISPLGNKVVALFGRTNKEDSFDGPHAYDFDFSNPVKVCNDETHSGWAFNANGDEMYVCQVNNANGTNAPANGIAATNILTGKTQALIFHEDLGWDVGGFHFGRFYDSSIGEWDYMTTYSNASSSTSWARN